MNAEKAIVWGAVAFIAYEIWQSYQSQQALAANDPENNCQLPPLTQTFAYAPREYQGEGLQLEAQ